MFSLKSKQLVLVLAVLSLLFSCQRSFFVYEEDAAPLTTINIIDRNGFSETISNPERLKQYENVNFLAQQPYQKVLRVFGRNASGDILAYITSYHPNGQVKQYLEVANNRAYGMYREWHANGILKLEVRVIGGEPDINTAAEKTWLFDGTAQVFDEENRIVAKIDYQNGELEGPSTYYHNNGSIWKILPYHKNQINGTSQIFLENGNLLQSIEYAEGKKHGPSIRYWTPERIAADEMYANGLLQNGKYYDSLGKQLSFVANGVGFRAVFGKDAISELQEFHHGQLDGKIKIFGDQNEIVKIYHVKNDLKHGEEIDYYPPTSEIANLQPRLSVNWVEGRIHGSVKSWYPNGTLESQREMSNNKKNGLLSAWYQDGSLMLIEEYDYDNLVKGEYFLPGEKLPISQVANGKGTATLFDAQGTLLRKVNYNHGKPERS